MTNQPILSVKNLSKSFGGLQVIEEISLHVRPGERIGLIGPNGAGKTTLFNMIAGDLLPTSGTISYLGETITTVPNYKRTNKGIVRTFQKNNLLMGLTVKENLLLVLQRLRKQHTHWWKRSSPKNYSALYQQADSILEEWNLFEYRDRKVDDLSYGVQRQIEITLAVSGQPKLLLLDEPTAGMSQVETDQIVQLINRLPSDVTIMMIEHDIDVLFNNVQRVVLLHAGKLIVDDTPEKVKNHPEVKEIYMGKGDFLHA